MSDDSDDSDDAFPGKTSRGHLRTMKVGNDYRVYLPSRFGTEDNEFPLNNIPEALHDGHGYTSVSSMQKIFGRQFTKDHAISNKGIAFVGSWHPKTDKFVEGLELARTTKTGSFANALFAEIDGKHVAAFNAFDARKLRAAMDGPNSTRRQADQAKLDEVNKKRR